MAVGVSIHIEKLVMDSKLAVAVGVRVHIEKLAVGNELGGAIAGWIASGRSRWGCRGGRCS